MDKNLDAYIFRVKNFLNEDERKFVLQELEEQYWKKHHYKSYRSEAKTYDDDLEVSFDNIASSDIIMPRIWNSIKSYYDHYNMSWFTTWNGYSQVRYNKYSVGSTMRLHWDAITTLFDGQTKNGIPTLTVLGLLNDDFKGGEFMMFDDEEPFQIDAGEVIIFPSTFLYPHYVKHVTEGTRYSFVSWVY